MNQAATRQIVIGTSNAHKIREICEILDDIDRFGFGLRGMRADEGIEVVEDGSSFEENAIKKAMTLAAHLDGYVLSEDSGLEVDALQGAPGIYSARYSGKDADDESNTQKLLHALSDVEEPMRTARYCCVMALASPGRLLITCEGYVEGRIAKEAKGTSGFGYDPVFVYPPLGGTFAELGDVAKFQVSHRRNAVNAFREKLAEFIVQEKNTHGQ